jgi:hypothetical protein
MKCKNCNKEFIKTRVNVDGQIYCSIICRNQAAIKRQKNKIISDYVGNEIPYKKEIVGKLPIVKETIIENSNGIYQNKYEVKIEDFTIKIMDYKKAFIDIDDISIYIDNSENKNIVVTSKKVNVKN